MVVSASGQNRSMNNDPAVPGRPELAERGETREARPLGAGEISQPGA